MKESSLKGEIWGHQVFDPGLRKRVFFLCPGEDCYYPLYSLSKKRKSEPPDESQHITPRFTLDEISVEAHREHEQAKHAAEAAEAATEAREQNHFPSNPGEKWAIEGGTNSVRGTKREEMGGSRRDK